MSGAQELGCSNGIGRGVFHEEFPPPPPLLHSNMNLLRKLCSLIKISPLSKLLYVRVFDLAYRVLCAVTSGYLVCRILSL